MKAFLSNFYGNQSDCTSKFLSCQRAHYKHIAHDCVYELQPITYIIHVLMGVHNQENFHLSPDAFPRERVGSVKETNISSTLYMYMYVDIYTMYNKKMI